MKKIQMELKIREKEKERIKGQIEDEGSLQNELVLELKMDRTTLNHLAKLLFESVNNDDREEYEPITDVSEMWGRVLELVRPEMMRTSYDTWIKPLKASWNENERKLSVISHSEMSRSIVVNRYRRIIEYGAKSVFGQDVKIIFLAEMDSLGELKAVIS